MSSVLGALPRVAGSVDFTNTMSVPVCRVCVLQPGTPATSSCKDRLNATRLEPTASASVDIPYVEAETQPETWDVHVFGCAHDFGDAAGNPVRTASNTRLASGGALGL